MILFYSEKITPRIRYSAQLIFTRILNVEVIFTTVKEDFIQSERPKINYSDTRFSDEIYLKPNGLLNSSGFEKPEILEVKYNENTGFFPSSPDSLLPFDIFASAFYLVTRFEEYAESRSDKYGRFRAENSILFKYGLLQKPVVNIWAGWLKDAVQAKYPLLVFSEKKFKFISTIDVDNAWAYRNKGFWRTAAAFCKSVVKGNFSEITTRIKVLTGKKPDPYDTYSYLEKVFAGNEEKVRYFFLLGDYGKFDKNISYQNKKLIRLIQKLSGKFEVGIHPSFAATGTTAGNRISEEKIRLEKITGKNILWSRNHYLRLKLPESYSDLLKAGISADFTMGYAEKPGFRAGICTPFYFYDLEKEKETGLLVVPFQVMDGTLKNYLNFSPEKAWSEVEKLMNHVKQVGGTFVGIWHNESVSDYGEWKGYRTVFEKMNKLGFEWANE